jgi:AraC-like DNA-binding protein
MPNHSLSIDQLKEFAQISGYKVEAIATKCGVSARHFHRLTVLSIHRAPKDLIDEIRFQDALCLLASECPVKEIALKLGYNNTPQFCRQFRIKFGISPRQFRTQSH